MTVPSSTNRVDAVGNNVTVAFPVPFYFQLASDLVVTVDGVVRVIGASPLDYSVAGAGNPLGGTVTFVTAPVNLSKVVVRNIPPITQLVDFVNNVTLLESVLDGALDKLTILIQQLNASISDSMQKNSLITTPVWLGQGFEITNILDGTAPNSAATVSQILSLVIASGNVPTPLGGDVGKYLQATAPGVFSWQSGPAAPGAATDVAAGIVELATVAEVRSAAAAPANLVITPALLETASAPVVLTDAATVAVNWDSFINATLDITANRILGNPTNGQSGTWRTILVRGNNATPRTLTFDTQYFGEIPVITDASSSKYYLLSIFSLTSTHFVVSSKRAFG